MKVYVGTYARYNAGSLFGAWIDLNKFASHAEFIRACRKLHKGERDPELMFQDFEADEDWERACYSESAIDPEYWTLRAEAKKSARKSSKVDPIREEYAAALRAEGLSEKSVAYDLKTAAVIVKLSGGEFVTVDRASIETSHCEGEDDGRGRSMKDAQAGCDYFRTEEGFKRSNLRAFDRNMRLHAGRGRLGTYGRRFYNVVTKQYWRSGDDTKICACYKIEKSFNGKFDPRDNVLREATTEDVRIMRHAWMMAREDFKKRLNAYWKRFGASKLRTWTYWTEA